MTILGTIGEKLEKICFGARLLMDMHKGEVRQRFATYLNFKANELVNFIVDSMPIDIYNAEFYESTIKTLLTFQGLLKDYGLNDIINYSDIDTSESNIS